MIDEVACGKLDLILVILTKVFVTTRFSASELTGIRSMCFYERGFEFPPCLLESESDLKIRPLSALIFSNTSSVFSFARSKSELYLNVFMTAPVSRAGIIFTFKVFK